MGMTYLHGFLKTTLPLVVSINNVQIVATSIQQIGIPFVPKFVISDSIDPPLHYVKEHLGPYEHVVYLGHQSKEEFMRETGVDGASSIFAPPSSPVSIQSDIAFLAALELSVEQFGMTMPEELKTPLCAFITAEKTRRGFTS